MLELALCSLVTILPDYLSRRYYQDWRIGRDITLYSVWFELRWGITTCLMLTVLVITIIFYHHPSTTSATPLFRTVPILPESSGRVSEIYVKWRDEVEKGARILKLDSAKQEADLELARRRRSRPSFSAGTNAHPRSVAYPQFPRRLAMSELGQTRWLVTTSRKK